MTAPSDHATILIVEELQTLGARLHFKPLWDSDLKRIVHELLDRAPTCDETVTDIP